eukprot:1158606-Pelagomonas_calceolata.AAC.4
MPPRHKSALHLQVEFKNAIRPQQCFAFTNSIQRCRQATKVICIYQLKDVVRPRESADVARWHL